MLGLPGHTLCVVVGTAALVQLFTLGVLLTGWVPSPSATFHQAINQRDQSARSDNPVLSPHSDDMDDEMLHISNRERTQCIQDALYRCMGYHEHPDLRWLPGCKFPPVLMGFEAWLLTTGCGGSAHSAGSTSISERQPSPLRIHVTVDSRHRSCLDRFVRSWLMSQPAGSSILSVWVLGGPSSSESTASYADLVAEVQRAIEKTGSSRVRVHNVTTVQQLVNATASGCVTFDMWNPPARDDTDRVRIRAELLRLAVLHEVGGVWFDLCTVLFTPLPPVLSYLDEFSVMRGMSPHYSTVALALRAHSVASTALLGLVCR